MRSTIDINQIIVKEKPPASCVGWTDALLGLAALLGVFFALRFTTDISNAALCVLMIAANAVAAGTLEVLRSPWRKRPPSSELKTVIAGRAAVKYLGLLLAVSIVIFFYWLFPEYRKPYYSSYFDVSREFLGPVLVLAALYLLWAEWRISGEKDGAWHAGMLLLRGTKDADWQKLRHYALGWLVKGYFLPLMYGDLVKGIAKFRDANWNFFEITFGQLYSLVFSSAVTFELVFVTAGYLFTCRIFDAHIRLVEKTLFGWFAALICYGPFLTITFTRYFGYRTDVMWGDWLAGSPAYIFWGSAILMLMLGHMWCDACFGVRFSNLTHRGVITNGPYRWCKHPAYVIKNLRWWMVSVPFAAAGGWDVALRCSLLLAGVNIVYMLRSYAEEKMLSQDPIYVEYGLWMDKNGLMRWVGNLCPALKYENRLKKWLARGELDIRPFS